MRLKRTALMLVAIPAAGVAAALAILALPRAIEALLDQVNPRPGAG